MRRSAETMLATGLVVATGLLGACSSDGDGRDAMPEPTAAGHGGDAPRGFVEWIADGIDVCPGSNVNISGDDPPEGGLHAAHTSESGITEHLEVAAGMTAFYDDYGIGAVHVEIEDGGKLLVSVLEHPDSEAEASRGVSVNASHPGVNVSVRLGELTLSNPDGEERGDATAEVAFYTFDPESLTTGLCFPPDQKPWEQD